MRLLRDWRNYHMSGRIGGGVVAVAVIEAISEAISQTIPIHSESYDQGGGCRPRHAAPGAATAFDYHAESIATAALDDAGGQIDRASDALGRARTRGIVPLRRALRRGLKRGLDRQFKRARTAPRTGRIAR